MISFKEYLNEATSSNMSGAQLQAKIGKTRFANLIKHSYHKKFVQGTYLQPTAYRHTEDNLKHIIEASNDGKTMVQFHLYKGNHRVGSAHLFKWDGTKHQDGSKLWQHVVSSTKD